MCISANVSIATFIISIISSITLIYYGDKRFSTENTIIGLFFIYIAFVQILEFFIWTDIDGKKGINRVASLILPIYVYLEPLVLYNLQLWIYNIPFSLLTIVVESLYIIYTCIQYYNYIVGESKHLITQPDNYKTLNWLWSSNGYFNEFIYFALFTIAVFSFMPLNISLLLFIIGCGFLIASKLHVKEHYGSFYCFVSAFSPILFLLLELLL
jgi:hypothetical protein